MPLLVTGGMGKDTGGTTVYTVVGSELKITTNQVLVNADTEFSIAVESIQILSAPETVDIYGEETNNIII